MAAASSPMASAVGEKPHNIADVIRTNPKLSYASQLLPKQSAETLSQLQLCPVTVVHGEPVIEFTLDEINDFTREEGLHQAVVMKFSYGKPDLQEIRRLFSMQFDVQGRCNIGQLDYRHLLVRFDLYPDFVQFLSRSTGYMKVKDDEYFFRTFPWTFGFNPKEETTMAVVWISFPGMPPNLFAKKSLLSIASAAGKPLAVDKATQERTRPSAARVKVLLDLLDKHPTKVKLRVFDKSTGKSLEIYQEIVYDNMQKYCNQCKHQGHDEGACRFLKQKSGQNDIASVDRKRAGTSVNTVEQLQGDARVLLNAKRASQAMEDRPLQKVNNGSQVLHIGGDNTAAGNKAVTHEIDTASTAEKREDEMRVMKGQTKDQNVISAANVFARLHTITAGTYKSTGRANVQNIAADRASDKDAVQISGNENATNIGANLENNTGNLVEDNKGGVTSKNKGENLENNTGNAADRVTAGVVPSSAQVLRGEDHILGSKNDGKQAVHGDSKDLGKFDNDKGGDRSKKGEDWTVVTSKKSPTNKVASSGQLSPGARRNSSGNVSSSNKFDVLAGDKVEQPELAIPDEDMMSKQLIPCDKTGQEGQGKDIELSSNAHSSNIPIFQLSSPRVEQIIKEAQKDMLIQSKLVKFFKPMVMLNTSIQDVPSQSLDSCGEFGGELVVSTDNNKEVPNTDWKGTTSNSKSWADQSGDEEEGDFSSTEEEEDESDECEEDMASPISPSTPKMGSNTECQSNSKLNAKAPHFVPKAGGQQQSPTGQTKPNVGQQHIVQKTASSSARNQPRRGMPRFRNTYRSGEVPIQCDTQSAAEMTKEYLARASEETIVRQLPMRVAKQKQVVPNRYK